MSVLAGALAVSTLAGGCADHRSKELLVVGTEMAFAAPEAVAAGTYTLHFENKGAMFHEVAVRDADGEVVRRVTAAAGSEASTEVVLPAGRYELGCFEPGHYEAGMKRWLTVG
jgi:uncharacterized cupredoxin-like copper-binding protein